jgi:hypothetical protein
LQYERLIQYFKNHSPGVRIYVQNMRKFSNCIFQDKFGQQMLYRIKLSINKK